MFIDDSVIENEIKKLLQEQIFWFTTSKLDAIAQVKNVTAVVVKDYAPNVVPPQTWWVWVDTAWWKSYIAIDTQNISDWRVMSDPWPQGNQGYQWVQGNQWYQWSQWNQGYQWSQWYQGNQWNQSSVAWPQWNQWYQWVMWSGINFWPGAVTSITVTDWIITAIS